MEKAMKEHFLTRHVYLRTYADAAILLDLKKNEYLGFDSAQVSALSHVVHGWPRLSPAPSDPSGTQNNHAGTLIDSLVRRKVLTPDKSNGKSAAPPTLHPVDSAAWDPDLFDRAAISLADSARLFSAVLYARATLRFLPLARIIATVQKRKNRTAQTSKQESFDLLRQLTGIFYRLRPFMYSHQDKCLLDSLTLVEFLSQYEIFPTLVFGVKTKPFVAHAWVQQDSYVLTSTPWYVHGFSPILAV
jgi:hypothetical protein